MDKVTRKQLKTDDFAVKLENTVEFFDVHRQQAVRYGAIAAVVALLVVGAFAYTRHEGRLREQALKAAFDTEATALGAQAPSGRVLSTTGDKTKAVTEAFASIASKYPSSDQGAIAEYYLGSIAADNGDLAQAQQHYQKAADSRNANYASLAKLALADIYKGEDKSADAEKILRGLMNKPTDFVSKDEATILLAQLIGKSNPEEAQKLLQPLAASREDRAASRAAAGALGSLKK